MVCDDGGGGKLRETDGLLKSGSTSAHAHLAFFDLGGDVARCHMFLRSSPISARAWGLFAIGLLGCVLRLALWFVSDGSNDIRTWLMFARSIRGAGLEETYRTLPLFNHRR
jgi:hypothetical protein